MAQTITTKSPKGFTQVATGRYLDTGTVAAYQFALGFKPRYVKVVNLSGLASLEWFEGMSAANALKEVTDGTKSKITSNGITVDENGFTLGLDTDVNVSGEQVSFIAMR